MCSFLNLFLDFKITKNELIEKIIAVLASANYDLPVSTIENRLKTFEQEEIYFYNIIPSWDGKERVLNWINSNFDFDNGIDNIDIMACFSNMVDRYQGVVQNRRVDGIVPLMMGSKGCGKTSFSEFLSGSKFNWFRQFGATSVYAENPDLTDKKDVIMLTESTIISNIDELCAWKRKDFAEVKATVNAGFDRGRKIYCSEEIDRVRGFNVLATTNELYPLLEADRRFMFFHGKQEYNTENQNIFWFKLTENDFWQFWAEVKFWFDNNIISAKSVHSLKNKLYNISEKYCFNQKSKNENKELILDVYNFLENLNDDFVSSEIIRSKYFPKMSIQQSAKEYNSFIKKIFPDQKNKDLYISERRFNGERRIFWSRKEILNLLKNDI